MNTLNSLRKGDYLHVIRISDWMAHTVRSVVYATGEYTKDDEPKPIFKDSPRSRKKFTLKPFSDGDLVFLNISREILTLDSEASAVNGMTSFSGNACFNFMQTPLEIQAIIESSNLNPKFNQYDRILSHATNPAQLAYPASYEPGTHAVIDRLINTTA